MSYFAYNKMHSMLSVVTYTNISKNISHSGLRDDVHWARYVDEKFIYAQENLKC